MGYPVKKVIMPDTRLNRLWCRIPGETGDDAIHQSYEARNDAMTSAILKANN